MNYFSLRQKAKYMEVFMDYYTSIHWKHFILVSNTFIFCDDHICVSGLVSKKIKYHVRTEIVVCTPPMPMEIGNREAHKMERQISIFI